MVTGDTYARAETIADLNPETAEEGDYTVQSRHRYKHFSDPVGPYSSYKVFKQPAKKKGNLSEVIAPDSCYGCGGYYYSTNYTFIRFGIRLQVEAFERDPRYDNSCYRVFGKRSPYGYIPLCPQNRFDLCRAQGVGCAKYPAAQYVALETFIIYIFGYRLCPKSTPVFSIFRPACKINV